MRDAFTPTLSRKATQTVLHFVIAVMVLNPLATALMFGPETPKAMVNYVGPVAIIGVALAGWAFLRQGRISLAIHVLGYGLCLTLTGIAALTGALRSFVITGGHTPPA